LGREIGGILERAVNITNMKFSLVIPVYNEEKSVGPLYREIFSVLEKIKKPFEIIFINDGSTDGTLKELLKLPAVKIIDFQRNFGQTAALDAGFKEAKGNIIVTMDGDGQNNPSDIPLMLEKLEEGYDVVCGWRHSRKDFIHLRFLSNIGRMIRRLLFNDQIHDSGCSLRVYRGNVVKNLDLYGEMHRYISTILSLRGFKVTETKVSHRLREYGRSKYRWQKNIKGFIDAVNLWFLYKYRARPLHLFGAAGILISALGFLLTFYFAFIRVFLGVPLSGRVLPIAGMFLILFGVQLFATGMLADILVRNHYSTSGEKSYFIKNIIINE